MKTFSFLKKAAAGYESVFIKRKSSSSPCKRFHSIRSNSGQCKRFHVSVFMIEGDVSVFTGKKNENVFITIKAAAR